VFEYFGEGQVGDMQLTGGNKAVAEHSASGESLLLFRKASTGLRFEGEMVCETFHYERTPDREGKDRTAIVFELRPLEAISEIVDEGGARAKADLASLLAKALAAAAAQPRTGTGTIRNVYERSRDIRDYVLARAGNKCEGCHSLAPFIRKDGSPYLEPHHIRRLSDGGPDHPAFVIALCPNCHRRVHAGADGETYNSTLLTRMADIEPKS
jgi:5-methylcytosine-specific restriction protein A